MRQYKKGRENYLIEKGGIKELKFQAWLSQDL